MHISLEKMVKLIHLKEEIKMCEDPKETWTFVNNHHNPEQKLKLEHIIAMNGIKKHNAEQKRIQDAERKLTIQDILWGFVIGLLMLIVMISGSP